MLPTAIANHTVTVQRAAGTVDDHGNDRLDWANPVEWQVSGCSFQPQSGAEDEQFRNADRQSGACWMPRDAVVSEQDRILVAGYPLPFRIVGVIERWDALGLSHLLLRLEAWEG